jgi:2-polyprenyl-3-methyl-5-hydroxy-6-metoxy-1,4-benzoquinol methylase
MEKRRRQANEETRQAWNANASFWDRRMGEGNDFVEVLVWPPTVRMLQVQSGERVLDIACGNGLTSRRLAALGADVVAIDFAEVMIDCARARTTSNSERIDYRVLDATDLDALLALGEGAFDAALCSMALFDMAEIRPLLSALTTLLHSSGRFVFSVLHPCFNSSHIAQMAEQEDREGQIVTTYAIKVMGYATPTIARGVATRGQPVPHLYFHRPLQNLLGAAFAEGLVLDALEEPTFPEDHVSGRDPLSWGANYHEIPPVLVARLRRAPRAW